MKKIAVRVLNFCAGIPMPVAMVILSILAYGLLSPFLGFYLDDWYIVLFQKYFGSTNFGLYFYQDRPLFGYVYNVFVPIFKDSILGWQIFAVIAHALAGASFWLLLNKLFPERKRLTVVASLLYIVYPGFKMHWFSVQYSQLFILLSIYYLSFVLMIDSIRARKFKVLYWIGALICLFIGIVPQETFLGIEFVRPLLIWVVLAPVFPEKRKRLKQTIFYWSGYLAVFLGFVIYRLANGNAYAYKTSLFTKLFTNPVETIAQLFTNVFWGTIDSIITAWTDLVNLLKRDLTTISNIAMVCLIIGCIVLAYLLLKNRPDDYEKETHRNRWILLGSLFVTVAAMAPFVVGGFTISLSFPNNRYLIAMAPGACLFLATLIDGLFHTDKQKLVLTCVLIGFAVGLQFITSRSFMLNWKAQQDFFWQLSWRAPSIKPNTVLLAEDLSFSEYYSGASLTAPLNIIYNPSNSTDSQKVPYEFIIQSQQAYIIDDFSAGQPVSDSFRAIEFQGNTSDMLIVEKTSDSCLHIINPNDSPLHFVNNKRYPFWQEVIPLANPDRIITNPDTPVIPQRKFFGTENRDQWCYYYEKADLARQQAQWQTTIQYYVEAEARGFNPKDEVEWLPLVEAYLKTNQIDLALETTKKVTNHEMAVTADYCRVWSDAKADENVLPFAEEILSWLNCRE